MSVVYNVFIISYFESSYEHYQFCGFVSVSTTGRFNLITFIINSLYIIQLFVEFIFSLEFYQIKT